MSRIFHFISAVQSGGAEHVALTLAENCKGIFSETHIVAIRTPKYPVPAEVRMEFLNRVNRSGLRLHEIGRRNFPFFVPLALLEFLKKYEVSESDILHLHSDIPDFAGAICMLMRKLTVVRTIHNTVFWPGRRILAKFIENQLRSVPRFGVSKAAIDAHSKFLRSLNVAESAAADVIYNGIAEPQREMIPRLRRIESLLNIIFVGRLDVQKGPDILLSAIALISNERRASLHLHMIGEGRLRQSLETSVSRSGLPVTFYGAVPNGSALMLEADLVVVPSRFEGFGISAVEAILAKREVVASACTGLTEVFPDKHEALCKAEDPVALCRKIEAVLERGQTNGDMALFERAKKMFSIDAMVNSYGISYENILASVAKVH